MEERQTEIRVGRYRGMKNINTGMETLNKKMKRTKELNNYFLTKYSTA